MDHCASVLLAYPSDQVLRDNDDYHKSVKLHVNKIGTLFKDHGPEIAGNAENLLKLLDPTVNSISYLAILSVLLPPDAKHSHFDEQVAQHIILFLRRFDPRQIRYYGLPFSELFVAVARYNVIPSSVAIPLLAGALLRLDPTGSMLTSNHLCLVKAAYAQNIIEPVLLVAEKQIVYYPGMLNQADPKSVVLCDMSLPPSSYISKDTGLTIKLTPLQVLEYDWLVGLCFCAVRNWSAAQAAFARVAAYPTREAVISKIMVDSYKKWLLVSLLADGRITAHGSVPSHTGTSAARTFGVMAKVYEGLVKQFESADSEALRTIVETGATTFIEDGNASLIQEVLAAHQKWQIVRLRDVYSKVSLRDINAKTKNAVTGKPVATEMELAALIEDMISAGMLRAVIEPPRDGGIPACLAFLPAEAEVTEKEMNRRIAESAVRIRDLGAAYAATKERLGTSKEFIKQMVRDQSRNPRENGAYMLAEEEEDLMTGII